MTELWTPLNDTCISKQPVFPTIVENAYSPQNFICVNGLVDRDLATTFKNFQYISILFNMHYNNKVPVSGALFKECIGYMQSSLLKLIGHRMCKTSQCIHLGLMVLFAATFRIPGLYKHPCCTSLAKKLLGSYVSLEGSHHSLTEEVKLWLTFTCLISMEANDELALPATWRMTFVCSSTWHEVRQQLKRVFWIDTFHDDLGTRAYEILIVRNRA